MDGVRCGARCAVRWVLAGWLAGWVLGGRWLAGCWLGTGGDSDAGSLARTVPTAWRLARHLTTLWCGVCSGRARSQFSRCLTLSPCLSANHHVAGVSRLVTV